MKRITMENCETLEDRKFQFIYSGGIIKDVQVAIIDRHIGMTCKVLDASGSMTDTEAICFDFRTGDKFNSKSSFLTVANDIERGVFKAEKWLSMFVADYRPGHSRLSECAFE